MTLAAATRLGPYEILAPLGAGGMGEVYRAKDTRLGREVAIKVLPAEVANDPDRLRRFEQEARAASAIHHPNLLSVFDVGTQDGVAYLVTELLSGESLREALSRGPLPAKRVGEIAAQLARGLAAAHEKGIVHRDLKPENLFLTRDGFAKILDFGLARVDRPELATGMHDASTRLETQAGTVLGTVGYMAPEQVRGERADARSDLFSLGVVLHEMLAGANPFRRDSVVESLHAILKEEPPDLAATPSGASSMLGRIVARLLEKDPERRFRSAHDLAFALDALTDPGAATSPAPAAPNQVRRIALAGLAAVALIAATVVLLRSRGPAAAAAPIRALAVLPFTNLSAERGDDYFSDGLAYALTTELARLGGLKVIAANSSARYKASALAPAAIARELGVEGLVSGSVLRSGGRARISAQLADAGSGRVLWAESYDRDVRDVLSLQGEVAQAIAQAIALQLSPAEAGRLGAKRSVDPRALDEYLKGRALWSKRTETDTRQALAHFQAAIAIDPGFALGHTGVADAYVILAAYDWMPPLEAAPLALAALERATTLDPTAGEPHATRGDLAFHVERDFALARREHDRAVELSPGYATAYHWRAEVLLATGDLDAAIADLRHAIELDPYAASPRHFLGRALELAGHPGEAEQAYRFASDLSPRFLVPRAELIRLQLRSGRGREALDAARAMVALESSPIALSALAICLAETGKSAEARDILARLREDAARGKAESIDLLAVEAAIGDQAAALATLRESMDHRRFWISQYRNRRLFDIDYPRLRGNAEVERLLASIGTAR